MAEPAAPPNKKRQRMILIGAAAAGLLLLLYLRSRSASSPNATSATDTQGAYMQGAQAQAAQDAGGGGMPSTFADNGANAAALGDALTQGLQSIGQQFQQFENTPPSWYVPPSTTTDTGSGSTAAPAPQTPITINVGGGGGNVGTGTAAAPNTQTVSNPFATQDAKYLAPGVSAPHYALTRPKNAPANARWGGPSKPTGNWVGIGGGWWRPGAKK